MERESGTQVVGASTSVDRIDDELPGMCLSWNLIECVENAEIDRRTLTTDILRVDHSMTKVAGDTVKIIDPRKIGSIRRSTVAGKPCSGSVAAQAKVAGLGGILIGDGKACMKERVSSRLRHNAGLPCVYRRMSEIGVTKVTRTAGDDRFTESPRLCTGLSPILDRGWYRQILSLRH